MIRHGLIAAAAGGALAMAIAPPPARAQVSGAPTQAEIERGRPVPIARKAPGRVSIEGGVERAPCPLANPSYANVTVRIDSVRFNGLKEVAPAALDSTWHDYAGRTVPVAALCEIRDRAATALRAMGYLAAIQIPPQRIATGGEVTFDVLMAHLTAIQVRGDAGHSAALIAAMLNGLTEEPVFNTHAAERRLLLAGDLPGYNVRLVLRPAGGAPGDVVGEVLITRQPIEVDVNVDDLGSRAIGRYNGLARMQINDLTGLGDSTVLSLFNTADLSEQTVAGVAHSFAIGPDGLRFSGDFTFAWSRPDIGTHALKSRTQIAGASLSYPIVRRQDETITAALGFEAVNQSVRFGGTPLTDDRLRTLQAQLGFDLIDPTSIGRAMGYSAAEPRWRVDGTLEVRQGLSILDASHSCGPRFARCLPPHSALSRLDADPSALLVRFSGNAEYRPLNWLTFALKPRAQYSASVLLNYEEIGAGNYTIGRGYDPGSLLGDSGVGVAAEARFGSLVPRRASDLALQPYVFFDQAWSWINDAGPQQHDPQKLSSAGGGLRGAWGNRLRFDASLAVPLRRAPLQRHRGDVRVLFTISTLLFPWRLQ